MIGYYENTIDGKARTRTAVDAGNFRGSRRVTKYKINPLHPTSDLQILLSLSPDDFTRQRETP